MTALIVASIGVILLGVATVLLPRNRKNARQLMTFAGVVIFLGGVAIAFMSPRGRPSNELSATKTTKSTEITQSLVGSVQTDPVAINGSLGKVTVKFTSKGSSTPSELMAIVALHDGIKIGDQVRLDWIHGNGNVFQRLQMISAWKTVKTAGGR